MDLIYPVIGGFRLNCVGDSAGMEVPALFF